MNIIKHQGMFSFNSFAKNNQSDEKDPLEDLNSNEIIFSHIFKHISKWLINNIHMYFFTTQNFVEVWILVSFSLWITQQISLQD